MCPISGPSRAAFLFLAVFPILVMAEEQTNTQEGLRRAIEHAEKQIYLSPNDIQLHFTRGMLLGELARYAEAADEFRWMLTRNPALLRPRLELGRMLMLDKNYEGARYHFEQVLANDLPDAVGRNVLHILSRIREELPSLSFAFDIVSDSNPRQATSDNEIVLGGLRYRLSANSQAKAAAGFRFTLDGKLPIGQASLSYVRIGGEQQRFRDSEVDLGYLQLATGRTFRYSDFSLTLDAGVHHGDYGGRPLYDGAIFSISAFKQVLPNIGIKTSFSGKQFDYDTYPHLGGWQHVLDVNVLYASSPTARWEVLGSLVRQSAKESPYSYLLPAVGARYLKEWPGGWLIGMGIHANAARYDSADPFFGIHRNDREIRVEADVANRQWSFMKFTPRLQLGITNHKSNINLFAFRRSFVRLGMTAEF